MFYMCVCVCIAYSFLNFVQKWKAKEEVEQTKRTK